MFCVSEIPEKKKRNQVCVCPPCAELTDVDVNGFGDYDVMPNVDGDNNNTTT